MAKKILLASYLSVASNDLSAFCNKIELKWEAEEKEVTTFGSGGAKEVLGGLKSGELSVEFKQDYAASQLDSIMFPLIGTVVAFEVRPDQAVVGTGNPKYTGSILIKEWSPVNGSVGDDASVSAGFTISGVLTRATS